MGQEDSWRSAMRGCAPMLEALAKATTDNGRMAARTWWVLCMGSKLDQCRDQCGQWRSRLTAQLPSQLKAEDTPKALGLPAFEPLACILASGEAVRVMPGNAGSHRSKSAAKHNWDHAVSGVDLSGISSSSRSSVVTALLVMFGSRHRRGRWMSMNCAYARCGCTAWRRGWRLASNTLSGSHRAQECAIPIHPSKATTSRGGTHGRQCGNRWKRACTCRRMALGLRSTPSGGKVFLAEAPETSDQPL